MGLDLIGCSPTSGLRVLIEADVAIDPALEGRTAGRRNASLVVVVGCLRFSWSFIRATELPVFFKGSPAELSIMPLEDLLTSARTLRLAATLRPPGAAMLRRLPVDL